MIRLPILLSFWFLLVGPSYAEKKLVISYSTAPVAGIPQEWVEQKGLDVLRYANYIKSLKLKNIEPYLVLYPQFNTKNGIKNSLPPRDLWTNIAETLKVIDKLATILDAEVEPFVLVYKGPLYNRAVRGRSKSQHLVNKAVRVKFKNVSPHKVAATVRQLRSSGFFKGGVGNYKSYTQIDTRGHNADW